MNICHYLHICAKPQGLNDRFLNRLEALINFHCRLHLLSCAAEKRSASRKRQLFDCMCVKGHAEMLKAQRDALTPLPEMSNWLCSRRLTDSAGLDCGLMTADFDGSLVTNASGAELSYSLGLTR